MTFRDLPEDFSALPLTTAGLAADVVDLFLGDADRSDNAILIVACDDNARIKCDPIIMTGVDWSAPTTERRSFAKQLARLCSEGVGASHAVAAVSWPGPMMSSRGRRWREIVESGLQAQGIGLIGFFAANPGRIVEIEPGRLDEAQVA